MVRYFIEMGEVRGVVLLWSKYMMERFVRGSVREFMMDNFIDKREANCVLVRVAENVGEFHV